jgi:small-conductance mechanosensitive channel
MRLSFFYRALLALLLSASAGAANAQSLPGLPAGGASPAGLPPGVRQDGAYLTAPVSLDGQTLFRVATLAHADATHLGVATRAQVIGAALAQLVATDPKSGGTVYHPQSLKVEIHLEGTQPQIVASDAEHPIPVPLVTVTTADAQQQSLPAGVLAERWQGILNAALLAALQKRQPADIQRGYSRLALGGAGLIVLTALLLLGLRAAHRTMDALEADLATRREQLGVEAEALASGDPQPAAHRRRLLNVALLAAEPERRLDGFRALSALIVWTLVALWGAGIIAALLLFPQTTAFGNLLLSAVRRIVAIWIVAAVLNRVADVVIFQLLRAYRVGGATSDERARELLRVPTIARAIGSFKTFALVLLAALATLAQLGFPITSVVTIGGVLALALTFAAQNLVRDFLNGLLVLIEDQYVVGDHVRIGEAEGIVEGLTLRVVQIRDGRGNLITIPHSAVVSVVNASRNWSRVRFTIAVDPRADLSRALEVTREAVVGLAAEPGWRGSFLDPIEWIGLDGISQAGAIVAASIRTAPLRQFEAARELNLRVSAALAEAGIALGLDPKTSVLTVPAAVPTGPL